MKEEEKEVDIDTIIDDSPHRRIQTPGVQNGDDDAAWADEEPDEDLGDWKMKVTMAMEDESEM